MSRIPKQKRENVNKQEVPQVVKQRASDGIVFSFEILETNEYFNLDATCPNWSAELFEMLKVVSTAKKSELLSGKFRNYRVHNHETATPPSKLPNGIDIKEFYQLRISKSKGGIHGVFYENTFYVVWLDPQHNMYPNEHYGGLKKIKAPSTCCKDREQIIDDLQAENAKLLENIEEYEKYIEEYIEKE